MFLKQIPVLTLLGMFIFQGCASVYIPNTHQIHMMEKKEEIHVAGAFGNNGLNLQGGVSVTDFLGIVAAYSTTDFALEADEERRYRYFEGGLNYFRSIGNDGKIEITAAVGTGNGESEQYYDRMDGGKFTKIYLQGSGSMKSSNLEGGASLRLANVNFTEFESTRNIDGLKTESFFFEPAVFVTTGSKNIRLESQLGYSFSFTDPSDLAFDHEFIRFTVGIRFILNR